MNTPHELTVEEWEEIADTASVRDAWWLEEDDDAFEILTQRVYAVRFDYQTGTPGYCGPLYMLKGDGDADIPPLMLIRQSGKLTMIDDAAPSPCPNCGE